VCGTTVAPDKPYVGWVRRFVLFHDKRHPQEMGKAEVSAYLSHFANEDRVSASTQNEPRRSPCMTRSICSTKPPRDSRMRQLPSSHVARMGIDHVGSRLRRHPDLYAERLPVSHRASTAKNLCGRHSSTPGPAERRSCARAARGVPGIVGERRSGCEGGAQRSIGLRSGVVPGWFASVTVRIVGPMSGAQPSSEEDQDRRGVS